MTLQEIFDAKLDIVQTTNNKDSQIWTLKLGENQIIRFLAKWHTPEVMDFYFKDVMDGMELTAKGNELRVFAAAKQILNDIIAERNPTLITFEADKTHGKGNRGRLYRKFLERWTPAGYKFSEITDEGSSHFYLQKLASKFNIRPAEERA